MFNLPSVNLHDIDSIYDSSITINSEDLIGKYVLKLTSQDSLDLGGSFDSLSKGSEENPYGIYQPPQIAMWYKQDDDNYRVLYMFYRGGGGLIVDGESKTDDRYGIPAYRVQYKHNNEWITLFGTKPNVIWNVPGSQNNDVNNQICVYDHFDGKIKFNLIKEILQNLFGGNIKEMKMDNIMLQKMEP